jgi:hypothetical protein
MVLPARGFLQGDLREMLSEIAGAERTFLRDDPPASFSSAPVEA